jgi:Domain of unknown function (DUF2760)
MTTPDQPSLLIRIALAFRLFFLVLFNAVFAGRVQRLASGDARTPAAPPPPEAVPKLLAPPTDSALQLLGLLQREGRLVDFLQEDVSSYADAEIGAAARVVHAQCKKALEAHVKLERIRSEAEGTRLTMPAGFSPSEIRLTGNVVGQAPFTGALTHAGWRAVSIELPQLSASHDVRVIAPAEVEL